jgi:hypothetical protein
VGLLGLALLNFAYWFTNEPAPSIRVRWRDDVSAARQAELERQYLLVDPRAPMENAPRSLAYDLLDTSRHNIEAMVTNPEVADTNDIDRENREVYVYTPYGAHWMWWAHRAPMLRHTEVRWTVITVLAVLALYGLLKMSGDTRPPSPRSPPAA